MKKILAVVVTICLLASCTTKGRIDPSAVNPILINNGDFEGTDISLFQKSWGSGQMSISTDLKFVHSGSKSLRFEGEGAVEITISDLEPGATYNFEAWVMTEEPGIANIGVKNYGGEELYKKIISTSYVKEEITFTIGSEANSSVIYFYNSGGSGAIMVDDITLVQAMPSNLVKKVENLKDNGIYPVSDLSNRQKWQYSLDFSDEFETENLDMNRWYNYHTYWEGRAPSIFSTENILTDPTNGLTLVAKALPDGIYTTACVQSRTKTSFGYFEVRAKMAPASITSSFWFQGKSKEIDVYESVGRSEKLPYYSNLMPINFHSFTADWSVDESDPFNVKLPVDVTEDYHVYGMDWNPKWIRFYFDGKLVHERQTEDYTEPMYIFLDMETFDFHGFPPAGSLNDGAGDYNIDYVRVWRSEEPPVDKPLIGQIDAKTVQVIKGTPKLDSENLDKLWDKVKPIGELHTKGGKPVSTAIVKTLWDKKFLYVLFQVKDPEVLGNEEDKTYMNDSVEVYFDGTNSKSKPYDSSSFKVNVDYAGRQSGMGALPEGIKKSVHITADGYNILIATPWVGVKPKPGIIIGFDVQINDATSPRKVRSGYFGWNDTKDKVWMDMGQAGNLELIKK